MVPSAKALAARPLTLRLLLACGAVGPLLFMLVFLILGATRPNYSPWHHFISLLSLGEQGWLQTANFFVCGGLIICFAIGLRRVLHGGRGATWAPLLLAVFGVCLIGDGIFATDPLLGYPPGAPETPTLHGVLHIILGALAFTSLVAACFVLAGRFAGDPAWRGWAAYSIVTGILIVVTTIAAVLTISPDPRAPTGLVQRLTIAIGWSWVAALAWRLMHKEPPVSR